MTYREQLGKENPPIGTKLQVKYMEGVKYYLLWDDCPDLENIVATGFANKAKAEIYATKNGWVTS